MAEGRVGLRGSWCERGHVVTLPFEDHIKPPTLHRPKFRFEMSSMVYMKRCSSFCHSPKTIISIPIKNTCGAFAGICTVQLRLLLIFLRIQDYKYRQTWWLFRLPSSTDYEEPRAENTKASCVPRSDVVGAQPEVILDCWRKARMFSVMAWAIDIEMREEPGCETLMISSQAPWKPKECQLELPVLCIFCTLVSSFPLPSICLFCSLSPFSSLSNVVSSELAVGALLFPSFMPRPLLISCVMFKMLNLDICGHWGMNSPSESEHACPRLFD